MCGRSTKMNKFIALLMLVAGVASAAPVPPAATQPEVDAGLNRYKYVTPFTLRNTTGLPVSATNAIAQINGNTSNQQWLVITLNSSSNFVAIQSLSGLNGGTNYFNIPTASYVFSGVLSSNDYRAFTNKLDQTNGNALNFTNRGLTLLQGNTIAGTNGWTQWGDSANSQNFTNWNLVYQNGSIGLFKPGTFLYISSASQILQSNSVIVLGNDGSDSASGSVVAKFGTNAYINAGNVDSSADTHYTFSNNLLGTHTNDIVRMRDLTNLFTISSGANTLFVDPTNGNDSTAIRGRRDRPFLNITNAMAASLFGDMVFLYPGIYVITNTSIVVSNGVSLVGSGRGVSILQNCISNTFNDAQLGACIHPGSGSKTADLTITNIFKDTKHQATWGVIPVGGLDAVTNAIVENVDMYGDYDAFYWGAFLTPSSFEVRSCYIEGKIDSFAIFTATTVTGKVYNTTINTKGPAVFGSGGGNAKGINIGNPGIGIEFYHSTILCSGSTVENLGVSCNLADNGAIKLVNTFVRAQDTGAQDIKGVCTIDSASTFDYRRVSAPQILVLTNTYTPAGGTNAIFGQVGLYGGQTESNMLLYADAKTNAHGLTGLSGGLVMYGGWLSNIFGANGSSTTNTANYGETWPTMTQLRVAMFNGHGDLTNVTSGSPSTDFVHADGSVGSAGGSLTFYTNTVAVAAQPNLSIWAGANINVFATNVSGSSRVDYTIESTAAGGSSISTNGNQFGPVNQITIKSNALFTNITVYVGETLPYVTATRVLMANGSGNITNVTPNAVTDIVLANGTTTTNLPSPSISAGIVFTEGANLQATNRFRYDRTNEIELISVTGNTQPGLKLSDTGSTFDLYVHPRGIRSTNGSLLLQGGDTYSWALSSTLGSWIPNGTDSSQDVGGPTAHVRTNWNLIIDTTNILQRGFSVKTPRALSTNGAAIFTTLPTNLIADASFADVFTNYNISFAGTTNIYVTNLNDHQEIKLLVFVATGNAVSFPQFTATNYPSTAVEVVDTNTVSEIKIWRTGLFTNIHVTSREFGLVQGANITFTTNFVAGTVSVAGGAGGGGSGIIQMQTNNVIIGNQTNINFFGDNMTLSATNNSNSNKVDLLISSVVRQISISGSPTSQQIDFSLGNRYVVTNMANTNQTYNLTNFADGRPMFIEVPANNLGTNFDYTFAVASGSSSTNIKWLSSTNPLGNITLQTNATYVFSFITDVTPLATNIVAAYTTTTGNPNRWDTITTGVGYSASNAFVGGVTFKQIYTTAFTNLNTTIATFTNAAPYVVPAHALTNLNDTVITTWRGVGLLGTNAFKLIYGSTTILNTGSVSNNAANAIWEAQTEITRTGPTSQHVDAYVVFNQQANALGLNGINYGGYSTNFEMVETNGVATSNLLQVASSRAGAVSNNFLKVVYERGPR